MKAKKLRQKIRKENVNILRNYINELKQMKWKYRFHIAWSIMKGKRLQAEILRFILVLMFSFAIVGVCSVFGADLIEIIKGFIF